MLCLYLKEGCPKLGSHRELSLFPAKFSLSSFDLWKASKNKLEEKIIVNSNWLVGKNHYLTIFALALLSL